jgi:hypothetical protein
MENGVKLRKPSMGVGMSVPVWIPSLLRTCSVQVDAKALEAIVAHHTPGLYANASTLVADTRALVRANSASR